MKKIIQEDGWLGLVEKVFFQLKKRFWTFYYRFRFARFGRHSFVTGPISLRGGKMIEVGEAVVIEGGALLRATGGGKILIGDQAFLERGARLTAEGELSLGKKVTVLKGADVASGGRVKLGEEVWIAARSSVGGRDVVLEDHVIIGPSVFVMDADHEIDPVTQKISMRSGAKSPVLIKTNAWIGAGAIVLKGVMIGERAVIGAGSVVTKDVPDKAVAVGNPARILERSLPPGPR